MLKSALPTLAFIALSLLLAAPCHSSSENPALAPTPPMGWNSWDAYGQTINEAQIRANADWMAKSLERFGWTYIVVDEGWYLLNPGTDPKGFKFQLTKEGRFAPDPVRFPSSAGDAGFKPLADYVHSLGLKFGLHIIRGIPREAVTNNLPIANSTFHAAEAADTTDTCPWNAYNYGLKNSEAGQAYYDSIVQLYATWGVDFIKADCISDHPYKPDEIRMLSTAIKKSGRPIVLSLSPGPTALENADHVAKYSEMWRISDDFWDHWGPWEKHEWSQGLYQQFANAAKWAAHVAPGGWPDADMLPIGHLGPHPGEGEVRDTMFTKDEQRTLMTLWSIFRSPLMMGGDLTSLDDWTTSLLTNPEVIAVNQHSRENRAVLNTDKAAVWLSRLGDPQIAPERSRNQKYYLAVFNLGDTEQTLHYEWKDLSLSGKSYQLRDLWEHKKLGKSASLTIKLQPHASALYLLEGRH